MSKKIMFKDKFCLTQAVLDGTKTMTRRELTMTLDKKVDGKLNRVYPSNVYLENEKWLFDFENKTYFLPKENYPFYKTGEIVAIAQRYKNAGFSPIAVVGHSKGLLSTDTIWAKDSAGWTNKMFTRADLMPHHIKITDVRIERLQAISDDDIMREGVLEASLGYYINGLKVKDWRKEAHRETENGCMKLFPTPREAYAALIDKVSGKGTWRRNPWMVVYEFELMD